jgi:hypothetical protein
MFGDIFSVQSCICVLGVYIQCTVVYLCVRGIYLVYSRVYVCSVIDLVYSHVYVC